ncbi:hypothetical protein [Streptomyces axinellae]|uniref:hypothetical protein n=1 Tax=Streptomyces axinellae TaxID=552788 RepID=UPI0031DCC49D
MDAAPQDSRGTGRPAPGAYLAEERAARVSPAGRARVGRVRTALDGGRVLLVAHTGYEWAPGLGDLRPATAAERDAYDAARRIWLRTRIPGVRP